MFTTLGPNVQGDCNIGPTLANVDNIGPHVKAGFNIGPTLANVHNIGAQCKGGANIDYDIGSNIGQCVAHWTPWSVDGGQNIGPTLASPSAMLANVCIVFK